MPLPDLSPTATILPGDVNWYPDSEALLFSSGPASTTGSTGNMPGGLAMRIDIDGSNFATLSGWGGLRFAPDGEHILVQDSYFYLVEPDGSARLPVKAGAAHLADLAQGFVYIGHWIDEP